MILVSHTGMRNPLTYILMALIALALGACSTSAARVGSAGPLLVPYAGSVQSKGPGPLAAYPLADADFPRLERVAEGPFEVEYITVNSEFTYDSQLLGFWGNGGYRNRYSWRQTVTLP